MAVHAVAVLIKTGEMTQGPTGGREIGQALGIHATAGQRVDCRPGGREGGMTSGPALTDKCARRTQIWVGNGPRFSRFSGRS